MNARRRIAPLVLVAMACGSDPSDDPEAPSNDSEAGPTGQTDDAGDPTPMTGAAADCAAYCAAQRAGNCNVPDNCGALCEARVELFAECSDVLRESMRCLANDGFTCEGAGQIRTNTNACAALAQQQADCLAQAMQNGNP